MKRLLAILLACSLLLEGCDAVATALAQWQKWTKTETSAEQAPEGRHTVSGKIKELRGNEMALELGTLQRSAGGAPDMESGGSGAYQPLDGQQPGTPPEGGGTPPDGGGAPPQGERTGEQSQKSTKNSHNARAGGTASGTFEKSGETAAYTIPVKTPVYASGNNQTALSFTLLEMGQVVIMTMGTAADGQDYIISIQVVET